ncbi:MAG: molybdopterin oxidoreductase family protein [Acidobacteriota bacterium]|jgi:anaerobic selenocysteine-containing dehydrogenase|nr:molybdopterin oxidoreductase family protein [Acidobacteriota bacterium]
MQKNHTTTHFRACNLCEAICGLAIEVCGDDIRSIRGDRDDPFSRGHICPKAVALQDVHSDPDRLRHPVRRMGDGSWKRLSWDEALDEVGNQLRTVQKVSGYDAVGLYVGNPSVHNWGSLLFGPPLSRALRTRNRFSASSVDQLPHHVAATLMFGHRLLLPIPDVDRTQFLLVLGANPVVSNGSMMTAPGFKRRLEDLKQRGGLLVVVDPRRTETAEMADRHIFIRPGSDALLLMALLQVIFLEGLETLGSTAEFCDSIEAVREVVAGVSPERVAPVTGIDSEAIRDLARAFATAPSAVCYGRLGVSTQAYGGLCQWLVNVLNVVTGNLDRIGGAMFTKPAVDLVANTGPGHLGRYASRVRGLPAYGGELPVAALAEEILTEGEGQIRSLLTIAGNPVLSTPNGVQLERALESLDFMAAVDFYLNETTRHADIILPPTSALEHDHYDLVFNLLAVRNVARYSPALFDPVPDTRHDWQILAGLHRRLEDGPPVARFRRWLNAKIGPRRILDLGLRRGPWGSGLIPVGKGLRLTTLEKLEHGLDLGPLEPCLPARLQTPNRRVELAPIPFVKDAPRVLATLDGDPTDLPLLLIGRRHLRSNNSWMHNSRRLVRGRDRCTLLMHPEDAARTGVVGEAKVAVVSRAGRVEAPLELSDKVMPGVVSLPHGWGHHRPGTELSVAEEHPGVSINDLTDELVVDDLCGNAVLSGVPVWVEKL